MPSLPEQPRWSRAHARIKEVEPLLSMRAEQRIEFMRAVESVSSEADLPRKHLRTLREAENNLKTREAEEREVGR